MQNPQGIAVNSFLFEENLQLGNRPFYDLFAVVIGCGWSCAGAACLHGLFPDFPGEFPPLHSAFLSLTPSFRNLCLCRGGLQSRLRECGLRGPRLPPGARLGPAAAAASGAGGEPGACSWGARRAEEPGRSPRRRDARRRRRPRPPGAPGRLRGAAAPPQRPGSVSARRVHAARRARRPAAPLGLQQPPRPTPAASSPPPGKITAPPARAPPREGSLRRPAPEGSSGSPAQPPTPPGDLGSAVCAPCSPITGLRAAGGVLPSSEVEGKPHVLGGGGWWQAGSPCLDPGLLSPHPGESLQTVPGRRSSAGALRLCGGERSAVCPGQRCLGGKQVFFEVWGSAWGVGCLLCIKDVLGRWFIWVCGRRC